MKNRNEKHEEIRAKFDDIIKESIKMYMEEKDDTPVLSDDEMVKAGYSLPPDDMYDRIMKSCKYYDNIKRNRPQFKKVTWKKVLIIAAVIVIALVTTLNVSAVKVYIFKIINQLTSDTIKLRKGNEININKHTIQNDDAYLNVEKQLGMKFQKPYYLPEDMTIEKINIVDDNCVKADYTDSYGNIIKLEINIINQEEMSSESIDTKYSETLMKTINGKQIYIYYYTRDDMESWIDAIWSDDNVLYEIKTNVEQVLLDKVIEGFQY